MVDQTTVNGEAGKSSFTSNAAGLARDVGELLQLEAQVFAADLRAAKRRLVVGAIVATAAVLVALAALPIVLAAAAWALVELLDWSAAAAFAAVGLGAIAAAAIAAYVAWKRLHGCAAAFTRSRDELAATAQCLLHALQSALRTKGD